MSDRTITRLLANGTLRRQLRGVYVYGHASEVPYANEVAALLTCGEHAWLAERTAAVVWGMLPPSRDEVHLIVPIKYPARSRPGITVHRSRVLTPADVTIKDGLPVTTPAWTLLDLAERHSVRNVERALDEALALGLTSRNKLCDVLERAAGRHGAPVLRRLVEPGRPSSRTRSVPEEELLQALRHAGIEQPVSNVRIHGYEVDFLFERAGVVVEYQSFQWHNSRFAFMRDHRKRKALERAGLVVIPIVDEELGPRLIATIAELVETITRRSLERARERAA